MFRQIISVLLVLIIGFINIGFTLSTHYCHDKQVGKSLIYAENLSKGCDSLHEFDSQTCDSLCCSENDSDHEACCYDEFFTAENLETTVFNLNSDWHFIVSPIFELKISEIVYISNVVKYSFYIAADNSPPLYKLFCSLLFYA